MTTNTETTITISNPLMSRAFSGDWTCCSLTNDGRLQGFDNSPSARLPRTSLVGALRNATKPRSLQSTYCDSALYYKGQRVLSVNGCERNQVMAEVAEYLQAIEFDREMANKDTPY